MEVGYDRYDQTQDLPWRKMGQIQVVNWAGRIVSSHEQLGYPFTKWSEQMRLFKVRFVPTNLSMGVCLAVMGRLTEATFPIQNTLQAFRKVCYLMKWKWAVSEKAAFFALLFNKSFEPKVYVIICAVVRK